ncbi:MAG TPA: lytic transglycosylase domain-containing protein [Xanthomonadaceae bacterium]|nr:lytic transglycosylase domain-containing protein [Xanthomonadaceae bacterium]
MRRPSILLAGLLALATAAPAPARTVYECLRDGTLSLATVPEPGSRCVAKQARANRRQPNYWGSLGPVRGPMYRRVTGGATAYSTRAMPGWSEVQSVVALSVPADLPAHAGLGRLGTPRLDAYAAQFRAAARRSGVEDAWLRAIAHAESGFDPGARSPRGAQGLMQLMPEVARAYGVADPYSPTQSIDGAARHLHGLMRRYNGDLALVAAAYNAGTGAVARYRGVPPYAETQAYVGKVQALYARYRSALRQARTSGS